ncbi:GDSL-type esterase/lipase family protein [Salegentibacter sp. UBA1130]|uniref:GDSL-type esterase/lipase family protein n=1 Tax=Salegentibacter sp. UBA1130 TaxID=1947451 RepID=UPI002580B5B8|nr:GDSL-type esterase/lipase family protein [Salegentibacter sp. UBA1130]
MKLTNFLLVILLVTTTSLVSQTIEVDSLHRPRNYHIQVNQFQGYPDSNEDITFLGNSITAGTNWNELLGLPNARNRGISGDTTFGILERLDEVIEGEPSKVFILIGINDIARNYPDELIISNYEKIISRIKEGSPNTEVFIQSILPVNNTFTRYKNHYNKDEHILAINKELKNLSKTYDVNFIDIHPHFLDKENRLSRKFTEEGLHLNAHAYKNWAKILKPYLN